MSKFYFDLQLQESPSMGSWSESTPTTVFAEEEFPRPVAKVFVMRNF